MLLKIITKVYCVFLVTTPRTYGRLYNIEDDAVALYGEHFDTVLRRFRRTPDYLKILQERYNIMERHFNEITVQVMQSVETRISSRVTEMVKSKTKFGGPTSSTTNTPDGQQAFFRSGSNSKSRRQDEEEEHTTSDPVMNLDGYYLLHRMTTTKERNDFRQLGFDMARQMVQLIIKGMGPGADPNAGQYQTNPNLYPVKSTTTTPTGNGGGNGNGNGANPNGSGNANGQGNENGNFVVFVF